MKFGVVFPTKEIGTDPGVIRDFVQGVEELGFHHLLCYDHVLGTDTSDRPNWHGPYDLDDAFHEPLTLLSYVAACTERLELVTGILILPQRQTALVAKQTAQLDMLSGGRLRLGVGLGWSNVEYEALGVPFSERAVRIEEQIPLLRSLWTERSVTFQGRFEQVTGAGLNPQPVQRPIPVWMGGGWALKGGFSVPALERIGRLADGWMPLRAPSERGVEALQILRNAAVAADRDPDSIGIEGWLPLPAADREKWLERVERWRDFGADHLGCYTMDEELADVDAHLERLREFRDLLPPGSIDSASPEVSPTAIPDP